MQGQLGVSPRVLTEWLGRMVEDSLLSRLPCRDDAQRTRHEYQHLPTEKAMVWPPCSWL